MMLNACKAEAAEGKKNSSKLSEGDGLYLQVEPNGSRYWRNSICPGFGSLHFSCLIKKRIKIRQLIFKCIVGFHE